MKDPAAGARTELREWLDLAAEARTAGDIELAVHHERDAARVEARIATLEHATGNALSFPMDGRVAA